MQLTSFFGENRTLAFVLAAVCLLIGVALVFVLFRIVFGRGIKLPGGRSRQQRLGIVDAFEIDRQRQLVIVRRDNVEHLLMIGGPNDVVVEASIIRAEAREGRPARDREQPAVGGLSWPAGAAATDSPAEPAPDAARAAVPEPPPPISIVPPPRPQPAAPPPQPDSSLDPAAADSSAPAPPPSPRPVRPPPPLRPLAAGERPALTPRPPLTPLRREPRPLPPFLSTRAKPAEPPAAVAAEPGPTESVAAGSEQPPPTPEPPTSPAGEGAPPQAATDEQPSTAPKIELDPLESLEEEMAKLLGRSPGESR